MFNSIDRREALAAVGVGVLFMIIALVVQDIVQEIPALLFLTRDHFTVSGLVDRLSSFELKNSILYSLYIGITAGFIQEGFTFIAVDTRTRYMAFFIGLGFSAVDIAILSLEMYFEPLIDIHGSMSISGFEWILVSLNVVSSILFHPGTATFMKWGQLRGLGRFTYIISSSMHTVLDGGVVYTDLYVIVDRSMYVEASVMFWIIAIAISVVMFVLGVTKLSSVSDEEEFKKEEPVVF
ncbi:hypothetical protein [Thermoplasma sp.]|uniref:hypothetical protein n=1 Tax=Thermoplasma sp. TaxID=1973142 RepID=UPI0012783D2F|nr:hypothetical protein [Thermoplasma sp.]KAA8922694.1 MAG: hypothetical protein F6Q11_03590 [Thermoplasma sp.]